MVRWSGSWRKVATAARAVTPQEAWSEWSMMDPVRSMSQRKGGESGGASEGGGGSTWLDSGSD